MRVFVMHKVNADIEALKMPDHELIAKIGKVIGGLASTGKFLDGAGLFGTPRRVRVTFEGGAPKVEPGPLIGAREPISGLTTIQVASFDEAIAWTKRYAELVPNGEAVVGPLVEQWDLGVAEKPAGDLPVRAMITHKNGSGIEKEPSANDRTNLEKLHAKMKESGVLVAAHELEPSKRGARLLWQNKKRSIIDGPYAESKELIAGYSLIRTDTLDEVLEWCWRFAEVLGDGTEIDVRVAREDA